MPLEDRSSELESSRLFGEDTGSAQVRIAVFQYITVGVFLFLVAGFWILQVRDHQANSDAAERNSIKAVPIPAPRGKILDRDGRVIVDNYAAFRVFLTQENLKHEHLQPIAEGLHIDLEELEIRPNVLLSGPQALRLPLTWVGILFGRLKANLAATGGVHGADDVIKLLMVGANVTMLCSSLMRHGINHLRHVERELRDWMEAHEYESVVQMQGSMSQVKCPDPGAFERAQYMRAVKGMQHLHIAGWR